MAADILSYDSNLVPVGQDQVQHIEVCRDLANSFNHRYGEHFVPPEAAIEETVATLPGLDGRKMSKSYDNVIPLWGSSKVLRDAIYSVPPGVTGIGSIVFRDEELLLSRPGVEPREFYVDIEHQRYGLQPHILEIMGKIDWRRKKVLEVGAGIATDARRLIGRGAVYTGITVDPGSTATANQALRLFNLAMALSLVASMVPILIEIAEALR